MQRVLAILLLAGLPSAALGQASPESVIPGTETQESQAPALPAQDPFVLDPAVAFEAFAAGNYPRAFDLAITFAGRGDVPAMRLLGQMYLAGLGVDRSEDEAAGWFALAAEGGDGEAKLLLAAMMLEGRSVPRDEDGAARLIQEAADAGNVAALQQLAMLTLEGRGVRRDIVAGAALMRQAAEAQDLAAIYTMGILYAEGAGVRQDTSQAYRWYERAARRGHVEAQVELALGLLSGEAADADATDEQSLESAIFWLRRAAESGNPVAENRLAHAHAQGLGVNLDPVMAAYFHARAIAGGLGDARLDAFVASLSDAQRHEAQDRLALERAPASPFN